MRNLGYISLHRKITDHWLYPGNRKEPFTEYEAWLDLLLSVNHSIQKVRIKNQLIECNPGETIRSLKEWSKRWKWSVSKIYRFFKLLEKDEIIVLKSETVTTRITVCKWEDYQNSTNATETQVKRHPNASETTPETNNNVNNDNNVKKGVSKLSLTERQTNFIETLKEFKSKYSRDTLNAFYYYWTEPNQTKTKMRCELEKTWDTSRRLANWARREKAMPEQKSFNQPQPRKLKEYKDPDEEIKKYINNFDPKSQQIKPPKKDDVADLENGAYMSFESIQERMLSDTWIDEVVAAKKWQKLLFKRHVFEWLGVKQLAGTYKDFPLSKLKEFCIRDYKPSEQEQKKIYYRDPNAKYV